MKQEIKRETLNTRIKPSLLKEIREASAKKNISQSNLVEGAIIEWLAKYYWEIPVETLET